MMGRLIRQLTGHGRREAIGYYVPDRVNALVKK